MNRRRFLASALTTGAAVTPALGEFLNAAARRQRRHKVPTGPASTVEIDPAFLARCTVIS